MTVEAIRCETLPRTISSLGNSPATNRLRRVYVKVFPDSVMSKSKALDCRWYQTRQWKTERGTELSIGVAVLHRRGIAGFDLDLWRTDYNFAPRVANVLRVWWRMLIGRARRNGFRKTLTFGGGSTCLQLEVPLMLERETLAGLVSVLSNTENYVSVRNSVQPARFKVRPGFLA